MKENSQSRLERSLWVSKILAVWVNQEEAWVARCIIRVKDRQHLHQEIMGQRNLADLEVRTSLDLVIMIKTNLEAAPMIHIQKIKASQLLLKLRKRKRRNQQFKILQIQAVTLTRIVMIQRSKEKRQKRKPRKKKQPRKPQRLNNKRLNQFKLNQPAQDLPWLQNQLMPEISK